MKGIKIALFGCLLISYAASAQWQGTNPVYFTAGNVGIGVDQPTEKFHLNGNMKVPFSWTLTDAEYTRPVFQTSWLSGIGDYVSIKHGGNNTEGGTFGLRISDGFGLEFGYNNYASNYLQILPNGYTGFGGPTPQKKFEVKTDPNDYASIGTWLGYGQWSGIHFGYKEDGNTQYRKSAIVFERMQGDDAARGKIHILNNGGYNSASASLSDAKLTINYNGNVGIGTQLPETKLQIMEETSGAAPTGSTITSGLLISGHSTGGSLNMGINANATFYSWIQSRNRTSSDTYTLALNPSGGNVGIGTATPDAKLAVKGTVHAEEVKVDLNVPGPDYVFEENYNLPSLTEIENYIKQNKHLPEVPSAKEMEANGINLSEMNMLLLKKVEELTLHLIEAKQKSLTYEKRLKVLEELILSKN